MNRVFSELIFEWSGDEVKRFGMDGEMVSDMKCAHYNVCAMFKPNIVKLKLGLDIGVTDDDQR